MNWGEFKAEIEKQGVKDSDVCDYIDCHPDEQVKVFNEEWEDQQGNIHRSFHVW